MFIACRSAERARPALEGLRSQGASKVELLDLDLGDLASVRRCAASFLERDLPLHLLVNNAGLAGTRGLTASGFELAFGVNHIGHFLFTQLLLERIKRSAPARIVTVASKAHADVRAFPWERLRQRTRSITGLPEYAVSKLANVLFSASLAQRLAGTGVSTYSLHPGVVASDVWRAVPWPVRGLMKRRMLSTEDGARTSLYCATSSETANQTGLYYDVSAVKEPGALARDAALARELWKLSEAAVAETLRSLSSLRSAAREGAGCPRRRGARRRSCVSARSAFFVFGFRRFAGASARRPRARPRRPRARPRRRVWGRSSSSKPRRPGRVVVAARPAVMHFTAVFVGRAAQVLPGGARGRAGRAAASAESQGQCDAREPCDAIHAKSSVFWELGESDRRALVRSSWDRGRGERIR